MMFPCAVLSAGQESHWGRVDYAMTAGVQNRQNSFCLFNLPFYCFKCSFFCLFYARVTPTIQMKCHIDLITLFGIACLELI